MLCVCFFIAPFLVRLGGFVIVSLSRFFVFVRTCSLGCVLRRGVGRVLAAIVHSFQLAWW